MRIFLDIDGTILYEPEIEEASEVLDYQLVCTGLEELLTFVQSHCEPYWLSYRARLGKRQALEYYILPHLPECAASIPVAYWDQCKHEALDTANPFLWFDDYPEPEDLEWLSANQLSDSLYEVDRTRRDNPVIMLDVVKAKLNMVKEE